MAGFLIDTDTCSAHLRQHARVTSRFMQFGGRLYVSVMTIGELLSWTRRTACPAKYHQGLLLMRPALTLLNVDPPVAEEFGTVRAKLLDRGQSIGGIDLIIAATALVHGLTVATHNRRHFSVVDGLVIQDWLVP